MYKHAPCPEGCWENPGQVKAGTVTKVSSLAVTHSVKIAAAPEWRFYAEKEAGSGSALLHICDAMHY